MSIKIKRISLVVYCNEKDRTFDDIKSTLYSIIDQNASHLFYDVFILSDNSDLNFEKKLNHFIQKEELINFKIFSFQDYSGMPATFDFLLKNNIIKSRYVTLLKAGDRFADNFLTHFIDDLFPLNKDLFMFNHKEELLVKRRKNKDYLSNYIISKSKSIISSSPSGDLSQEEAISTKSIFFGKIWRVSKIKNIVVSKHRILYQDIFSYYQMILNCHKIWYENKIAGIAKYKFWIPEQMDEERVKLLSLTLNKMISKNPYINGQVLQLLALALKRSSKEIKKIYYLNDYEKLKDNFKIVPLYNLSKLKIKWLTKKYVKYGRFEKMK